MFYGVINESYDYTEYLEMELENSLLFFKSLDVVQESGIQILQEGVLSTIIEKIKEMWGKFIGFLGKIKDWIKNIFKKDSSSNEKGGNGKSNEVAFLNKDVIKLDKLPNFGTMKLGTESLMADIEKDIEESDLPAAQEYMGIYKDIEAKLKPMGDKETALTYETFDNKDEYDKKVEESLKDIKAAQDTLTNYSNEINKLEQRATKIKDEMDKWEKEIKELDDKKSNTTSHIKAFRSMNATDVAGLKSLVSAVVKIVEVVNTAEKVCNGGGKSTNNDTKDEKKPEEDKAKENKSEEKKEENKAEEKKETKG